MIHIQFDCMNHVMQKQISILQAKYLGMVYIVACQAHPALVKIGPVSALSFYF